MASGWAPDGAVQDQVDATVSDGVLRARAAMPVGVGEVGCHGELDGRPVSFGINRRGSKDSQLK